jgi:hypothetical protein
MADKRTKRIAEFIKPLRVKPGSKVDLGKDFDPGYKADYLKKKDVEGGAADPLPQADRPTGEELEVLESRRTGTPAVGRPPEGVPRDVVRHQHRLGTVVRHTGRPKWFARICAGAVLAHPLIEIDPQYPAVSADTRQELVTAKGELEAEAPDGAAADPYAAAHATAGTGTGDTTAKASPKANKTRA